MGLCFVIECGLTSRISHNGKSMSPLYRSESLQKGATEDLETKFAAELKGMYASRTTRVVTSVSNSLPVENKIPDPRYYGKYAGSSTIMYQHADQAERPFL